MSKDPFALPPFEAFSQKWREKHNMDEADMEQSLTEARKKASERRVHFRESKNAKPTPVDNPHTVYSPITGEPIVITGHRVANPADWRDL